MVTMWSLHSFGSYRLALCPVCFHYVIGTHFVYLQAGSVPSIWSPCGLYTVLVLTDRHCAQHGFRQQGVAALFSSLLSDATLQLPAECQSAG